MKDGVLTGRGGQGYLATLEEFDDLELFAEMRVSGAAGAGGIGGIGFRCQPHLDRKAEVPPGYDVRCDGGDPPLPAGSIRDLDVSGARAAPGPGKDGEWFTLRLRAEGDRLRTWINGGPAADCRDPRSRYRRGALLLLLVHQRSGLVEIRELRIRRLPRIA